MRHKTILLVALAVASICAWGDSIPYRTENFAGHFVDGSAILSRGFYMPFNGGKMVFGARGDHFVGNVGSIVWNGSSFSGTFSGYEQTYVVGNRTFIYYVTGTYSGTWNGKWNSLAHVQLSFMSTNLVKSGVVPEPGTWVLMATGALGIWSKWARNWRGIRERI